MSDGALSQNEINEMLGATDEQFAKMIQNSGKGSIPKDDINLLMNAVNIAEAAKAENEEINKKFYEDDYPDKCVKEQLSAIYKIHENFLPLAAKTLSEKLRNAVEVRIASINQITMGDFIRCLPNQTTLGIIDMNPLNGKAILELYMGNIPITIIILSLLENLRQAWTGVIDLKPKLEKTETNPDSLNIVPCSEGVVLLTFETKTNGVQGMINFAIPYSVIKPILASNGMSEKKV